MSNQQSLSIKRGASVEADAKRAAQELYDALYQPDISIAIFYCSPEYDLDVLGPELGRLFQGINLIGCTTAGEITPTGYLSGALTGVSIAGKEFISYSKLVELDSFDTASAQAVAMDAMRGIEAAGVVPVPDNSFAFLLVDGLSMKEEILVSCIYENLHGIQLFGGSAGDETHFRHTHLFFEGKFRTNVAILNIIQTSTPFSVFRTQHFVESETKMVVTGADPARRIVHEINGAPAGREFANLVGLEVEELTPLIFAAHPVVVRIGGDYFVRSIQKVNDDGSLTFFCAIDEGIVLTVAKGVDLVENLREAFDDVRAKVGQPSLVLGCDCILRRLESEQRDVKEKVGEIMAENNVIGFATYGEQFNALHLNQTFTGVAIGR